VNNESLQNSRHCPHDLQNERLEKKRIQSDFCLLRVTILTMGLVALMLGGAITLLIQQAIAAGTASTILTLKSRVTRATCNILTTDGGVVQLPTISPTTIGSGEWLSAVTPLNIGVNCSSEPESWLTLSMSVTPTYTRSGDYGSDNDKAIGSRRPENTAGPDLFLVDSDNGHQWVSFTPVLAKSQTDCDRYPGQSCVNMTPLFPGNYRLPLGVQMVIPVGDIRNEMIAPGLWQATLNIDITYQ
jgi:hypothetical protein